MTRSRIPQAVTAGVILATLASASHAANPEAAGGKVAVRSGDHQGFGRVVIETNGQTDYRLDRDGDRVVVRFADGVTLGSPPPLPRNVLSIKTDGPVVELTLKHGASLQPTTIGGRVVLDTVDAPEAAAAPQKPRPLATAPAAKPESATIAKPEPVPVAKPEAVVPAKPEPVAPAPAVQPPAAAQPTAIARAESAPPPAPAAPLTAERAPVQARPLALTPEAQSVPAAAMPELAQQMAPGRDVMPSNESPIGLMARRVRPPKGMDGSAFLVPFDSATGAASFQEGTATYIVFDERRPVDVSALRNDPVLAGVSVQLLAKGTLFRVPLPPSHSLVMTQMPQGWRVAAVTAALKQQPVTTSHVEGRLNLAAEQPGNVVNVADPDTGATLLVGTQHRPGQGIATVRRSTEFILRPTVQGVVVEPLSDSIVLKQVPTGFTLSAGLTGLALSSPSGLSDMLMDAARLTRRLDFSTMPTDALMRRAIRQVANAATAPQLAKGRRHRAAAESYLALGMAAEAQGLLQMAAEQDPKEAASPDTGALSAIAALLAGRPDEADALADPRLNGTDEIALWRAIRQAMADEGSPAAAAVFASTAPLVFQYPQPIREHILPLMIETMIQGGEITPAARLLEQRKDDPKLAYARALMRQAEGDTDQALSLLDTLAAGHDRFDRARAAVRAIELRLAARKLDKTQAADALDKLLYVWRGDARELALRERVAELRGQSGSWRVALAMLRQAEADFPEQAAPIHERLKDMFAGAMHNEGAQQLPPLDFVALMDENVDLLPDAGDDDPAEQALADRLLALDLPERAKPVLEKLVKSAHSAVAKSRYGASLATLQAREGNHAAAQAMLDETESADMPAELLEQRGIVRANAIASLGDPAAGATMLAAFRTAKAIEARAQILENASDWNGAKQAWSDELGLSLAETGPLDEAQTRTLLRLATATARAGDDAGLAALRQKFDDRIGTGPLADMFRLLTAEPVRSTADIKRSQQELNVAASLPSDLKALAPASGAR
jgi:hypothetical protein